MLCRLLRLACIAAAALAGTLTTSLSITAATGGAVRVLKPPANTQCCRIGAHHLHLGGKGVAFQFGQTSGFATVDAVVNAYSVTIHGNGGVTTTGDVTVGQQLNLTPNVLRALLKLAEAEQFFASPKNWGAGPNESVKYIRIRTTTSDRGVRVGFLEEIHLAFFAELFHTLNRIVGVENP